MKQTLHPLVLAAVDLGVGSLLYREVSVLLGVLLLAVGLLVLCSGAYDTLSHGSSILRRHVQSAFAT